MADPDASVEPSTAASGSFRLRRLLKPLLSFGDAPPYRGLVRGCANGIGGRTPPEDSDAVAPKLRVWCSRRHGGSMTVGVLALAADLLRRSRKLYALAFSAAVVGLMGLGASSASATDVLTQNWESGLGTWTVAGDFWHVENNPQNVSVKSPDINPNLVTLPDAGSLPSAFGGTHVAWFGDATSGTFCGNFGSVTQT